MRSASPHLAKETCGEIRRRFGRLPVKAHEGRRGARGPLISWEYMITRDEALELFRSDGLIGIGMEADRARRGKHPERVASYIIDRNINYTNFCTEYCSFCAFYRPM